jgi:hypothetical protein
MPVLEVLATAPRKHTQPTQPTRTRAHPPERLRPVLAAPRRGRGARQFDGVRLARVRVAVGRPRLRGDSIRAAPDQAAARDRDRGAPGRRRLGHPKTHARSLPRAGVDARAARGGVDPSARRGRAAVAQLRPTRPRSAFVGLVLAFGGSLDPRLPVRQRGGGGSFRQLRRDSGRPPSPRRPTPGDPLFGAGVVIRDRARRGTSAVRLVLRRRPRSLSPGQRNAGKQQAGPPGESPDGARPAQASPPRPRACFDRVHGRSRRAETISPRGCGAIAIHLQRLSGLRADGFLSLISNRSRLNTVARPL